MDRGLSPHLASLYCICISNVILLVTVTVVTVTNTVVLLPVCTVLQVQIKDREIEIKHKHVRKWTLNPVARDINDQLVSEMTQHDFSHYKGILLK